MAVLMVFNNEPYNSTDVTWNALRLSDTLAGSGTEVRIFLMNDAVDLARSAYKKPDSYDQDLVQMLKDLVLKGVQVKVCGTCMTRCGILKNQPYFEGAENASMQDLSDWILSSDKVLTF